MNAPRLALIAAIVLLAPSVGLACSCGRLEPVELLMPTGPLPTNVQIWARLDWAYPAPDSMGTGFDKMKPPLMRLLMDTSSADLVAEVRQGAKPVPIDWRWFAFGETRMVRIVPRDPLTPGKYTVVIKRAPRPSLVVGTPKRLFQMPIQDRPGYYVVTADLTVGERPLPNSELEIQLGPITVGAERDERAPEWETGAKGRLKRAQDRASPTACVSGTPHLDGRLPTIREGNPLTLDGKNFVAIYQARNGPIDYTQPHALVQADHRFELGASSTCDRLNFAVPSDAVHIGVRAIDAAGNLSAPLEFAIPKR